MDGDPPPGLQGLAASRRCHDEIRWSVFVLLGGWFVALGP